MKSNLYKLIQKTLLLLTILLIASPVYALRCGNNIVQVGDSEAKVLHFCGKPAMKTKIKKDITFGNTNTSVTTVTQWTYNFGPSDFLYLLSFSDGKLVDIDTDGYGYN